MHAIDVLMFARLFGSQTDAFFRHRCGRMAPDQGYWPDGLYTAPTDDALKAARPRPGPTDGRHVTWMHLVHPSVEDLTLPLTFGKSSEIIQGDSGRLRFSGFDSKHLNAFWASRAFGLKFFPTAQIICTPFVQHQYPHKFHD